MKDLVFEKNAWESLKNPCEKGYPKEVCGLLFGPAGERKVTKVEVLSNLLDGSHSERLAELLNKGEVVLAKDRMDGGGKFEFVIDPAEHYKKIALFEKEGLDQIGLFHSHPDHPAEPSPTDASQPYLAGWSNIIVAVHQGKFKGARSWTREKEDSPFQEQKILVQ